jgi:hypothetical protein
MSARLAELRRSWRQRGELYRVGEEANDWRTTGIELCSTALQRVMAVVDATTGVVVLLGEHGVQPVARQGCSDPSTTGLPSDFGGYPELSRVFCGETIVMNPPDLPPGRLALLGVPLRFDGRVIGAALVTKSGVFLVEDRLALTTVAACISPHLLGDPSVLPPRAAPCGDAKAP